MNLSFFKKAMRPPTRNGAIASAFGLGSPDVLSGDHPGYPASGDRPDHPASGDRPDHQADGPDSAAAAGSGFQARDGATTRATTVPLPEERDHRLRGLRTEPTGDVPATSTRTDRRQQRHSRGGLLAKVAVFVAVVALAVAPHPLYSHYANEAIRPGGISALSDQQLAAGIMWVPGSITFVIVIFVYVHRWLMPAAVATTPSRLAGEH